MQVRKIFKFLNPTPVQTPSTIDAIEIQQCFYLRNANNIKTTQIPATAEIEK